MPRLISLGCLQYKRLLATSSEQRSIHTVDTNPTPHCNMKVVRSLLWASAALEACTVLAQALLYTSEPIPASSKLGPPSISPITARLLLAQRLGLSKYHSLEAADEITLEILNAFGGEQRRIFEDENQIWGDENSGNDKFLLIIEGVSEPEGRPDFEGLLCIQVLRYVSRYTRSF